jgi:hypothetical protein
MTYKPTKTTNTTTRTKRRALIINFSSINLAEDGGPTAIPS